MAEGLIIVLTISLIVLCIDIDSCEKKHDTKSVRQLNRMAFVIMIADAIITAAWLKS